MMNLSVLVSILSNVFFAAVAAFFILREARYRQHIAQMKKEQEQHAYEVSLTRKIHESIDHSIDGEAVLDIFMGSLGNLYPYSTVSVIAVKKEALVFKTIAHERISNAFLGRIRNNMLAALSILSLQTLPDQLETRLSGVFLDDTNTHTPQSFFHVPLYVNTTIVGILSVASSKQHAYTKNQMLLLYKLANQASLALSRIKNTLDAEKEKLMAMIGSLHDGVMMIDTNHEVFASNIRAREFLQLRSEDPTMQEVLQALPNTYDFATKISRAIDASETCEEKDICLGEKTISISICPVISTTYADRKNIIGASLLLRDVTHEKSVAKMKEDFTHVIVHELRSPLTAIKAASQLMVAQEDKFNQQEKHKLLTLINEQARTLLDEVSLILDAAKLQAGLFTVQKTPNDMKKTIHDAVSVFLPQAQSKYVQIIEHIADDLPLFAFDTRYINQVINNLISNSLKFTPVGGKITIEAKKRDNDLQISVSDTGIGIPKEKQSTLFTKFSQIRNPSEKTGTGLGLYIVKGIIEAHGGTVNLESEPGRGTRVYFTLPLINTETTTALPTDLHQNISKHIVTNQYFAN